MSHEIAELLRSHRFTDGFWPEHVSLLAEMASRTHFKSGELIFLEGETSSLFYMIVTGTVALEVQTPGHSVRVATLYPGDILGWSSITGDNGKQFQARALEEVHALAFDGARLCHACQEDYAFGFFFMRAILAVTSNRLHAIRAQLLDAYTPAMA